MELEIKVPFTVNVTEEMLEKVADKIVNEKNAIVLPCPFGTHLWRVTYPYRKDPKVTEYTVENFRTIGKKHRIQLEVKVKGTNLKNWMPHEAFFTTKEAAEKALAKKGENIP